METEEATPDTETSTTDTSTVEGATDAIVGLMSGGNPEEEDKPNESTDSAEDAGQDSEESPEDTKESETEDASDSGEDNEEDGDTESDEEAPVFTVKINGKEVEVPLDELKDGYSRTQDYTRKTMEVAEQRRIVEQQQAESLAQQEAVTQEYLRMIELSDKLDSMISEDQNIDWRKLAEEDPTEYQIKRLEFEEKQKMLSDVQSEQMRIQQEQQVQQNEANQQWLRQQYEQVVETVPELADPAKAREYEAQLHGYLGTQGYTPEEAAGFLDARVWKLADKARKYDDLMAKKPAAKDALRKKPKMVKPSSSSPGKNPDRTKTALNNHRTTGTIESAADAIMAGL